LPDDLDFGRESIVHRENSGTQTSLGGVGSPVADTGPVKTGKYTIEATVGHGGMGEVLLVTDHDLRRQIAMKIMRPNLALVKENRAKFIAEAQATSQLEHPGIPPVHDLGVASDGNVYFTMKLVRGQTLREVLKSLLLEARDARREYTLHRLVTVLERVAEAVHFAHEKGVIHRDLKPDNIMLGSYGEVHVMDWGLARLLDAPLDESSGERRVDIETEGGILETQAGVVKGTVPYMSPEQADGRTEELGRATDVYALGCILYEILTLHRAFDGRDGGMLERVKIGEYPPVDTRNPRRPVPEALADLCRVSMARIPADRPETARDFARNLREWLDGTSDRDRRHRRAEDLVTRGRKAMNRFRALETALAEAVSGAEGLARQFQPHQPVSEKALLVEAREAVANIRRRKVLAFAESIRLLDGALLEEERNESARMALADLWLGRLREAESREDPDDAAFALTMIQRYDDGQLAGVVAGTGTLTLRTTPGGVLVSVTPLHERGGILVSGEPILETRTPIQAHPLPMGSYLCTLAIPGHHEVRYPVRITRNREWTGGVRLRPFVDHDEDWILIPAGPFAYGPEGSSTEMDLREFLIRRRPVTFEEYAEFLEALEKAAGIEVAAQRIPSYSDGPFMERTGEGIYRVLPDIVDGPARERCLRDHGDGFGALLPVLGVSWEDATAYCAWESSRTGQAWRLPTEHEREKAGRGVDGRTFPWGSLEDASLAKCRDSRNEVAQPEPAGMFPTATSIYGMEDAAGGAWEWTDSFFDERNQDRVLRGGSWSSILGNLKCSARISFQPTIRTASTGFRCARTLE